MRLLADPRTQGVHGPMVKCMLASWSSKPETRFVADVRLTDVLRAWVLAGEESPMLQKPRKMVCPSLPLLLWFKRKENSLAQSRPFDLLASHVWSIFSKGPKGLTFYFWVLWATEKKNTVVFKGETSGGCGASPLSHLALGSRSGNQSARNVETHPKCSLNPKPIFCFLMLSHFYFYLFKLSHGISA